ncbi:helix-turn-helix domain-containing protein [Aliiroseovarius sp. 2305UL8-7]|uniref:helix-turn-helix domain-containing protein n=1 Tax=Aliiroseovarius conchicola TaxID=3121637 RepID=UPI00352967C7
MSRLNRFEWQKAVLQVRNLNSTAKLVASALSVQFANDETGQLSPGLATLMEFLGLPLSTLKRAIRQLIDAGWLSRSEGRGAGNYTYYKLLAPCKIVPFRPKKKGSKASLSAKEKGSQVAQKVSTHELSYKEQSKEQKARLSPSPDLPHEGQPGEALRFVPGGGGYFEREWDDALRSYGLSSLHRALPQIINDGQKGYLLPDRCPARRGSSLRDQQILLVKQLMEVHRNASELAVAA